MDTNNISLQDFHLALNLFGEYIGYHNSFCLTSYSVVTCVIPNPDTAAGMGSQAVLEWPRLPRSELVNS